MYNAIKTCIQRTTRMDDNYLTVKDIIDSLHFAPGTKIKLHYLERIGNTPYIEKTRTVTVSRNIQLGFLLILANIMELLTKPMRLLTVK